MYLYLPLFQILKGTYDLFYFISPQEYRWMDDARDSHFDLAAWANTF